MLDELRASGIGFTVVRADVRVQGTRAPASVARGLRAVAARGVDLVLLVRGGGAATDLAAFDGEVIARAIAELEVPVLTGIGHDIDRSVADEVAHACYKTPTACAQAVVAQVREVAQRTGPWRLSSPPPATAAGAGTYLGPRPARRRLTRRGLAVAGHDLDLRHHVARGAARRAAGHAGADGRPGQAGARATAAHEQRLQVAAAVGPTAPWRSPPPPAGWTPSRRRCGASIPAGARPGDHRDGSGRRRSAVAVRPGDALVPRWPVRSAARSGDVTGAAPPDPDPRPGTR